MKPFSPLLFATLFTATLTCWAADTQVDTSTQASALARAGGFDLTIYDTLVHSSELFMLEPESVRQLAPCIQRHGPDMFSKIVADKISQGLTQRDIQTALDYYNSPSGKRNNDALILTMHHAQQKDVDQPLPARSEQDKRAENEFLKTPASQKLGVIFDFGMIEIIKQKILDTCIVNSR